SSTMTSPQLLASLRRLLPAEVPPSLSTKPANLYQVLSKYPKDGVGQKVHQARWGRIGIEGSYWEVTRTRMKCEGSHGKAWGLKYWKGKCVSEREERIRGALKYTWSTGESAGSAAAGPPAAKLS
ncbi:uncharacterized protein BXZ73DRAFT_49000, partial [Epithele typhae]|uniref:uncharacterized protein n=1 Tax=Epithele typhae TaxID=378194 RepID=UPI002008134D